VPIRGTGTHHKKNFHSLARLPPSQLQQSLVQEQHIDEGGHVGNRHTAIDVHIGIGLIEGLGIRAQ